MLFKSLLNVMLLFVGPFVEGAGADWQFWASTPMVYSAFSCQHMVLSAGNRSCG